MIQIRKHSETSISYTNKVKRISIHLHILYISHNSLTNSISTIIVKTSSTQN